ncbi:putative transcriptional [Phaeomoniella chlamydospora]|uniref:Putative transcriptional n=1 Tax=Phaeomoniella chlamydospora TaxID=158046 RepID=A0A0G2EW75_PHACM|nr:putative transcriptional [Phaeomoniella chlamydospora]
MSDSESEGALARPSDSIIEKLLREQTRFLKAKEGTSVNTIRTAAEKALKLDAGFLRNDAIWKSKSKDVINDEIDKEDEAPASPPAPLKTAPKPFKPSKGIKRASTDENSQPPKKSRKVKTPPSESESEISEPESLSSIEAKPRKPAPKPKPKPSTKPQAKPQNKKQKVESDEDEISEPAGKPPPESTKRSKSETAVSESDDEEDEPYPKPTKSDEENNDDASSDLSSLIDEDPKPKKKRAKPSASSSTSKPKKKSTTTSTTTSSDLPPDQAEIKRLQSYLLKCGIRKFWSKELASYPTSSGKIKHLKQMLEDVGMTGRFSLEKANAIKEKRELEADIEAVKEGNERWGMESEDEDKDENDDEKPKRRLVRGRKDFDFLSSDGEETD